MADRRDRRDLSLRLNDVLDMVGASEKMRRLHQRMATMLAMIHGAAINPFNDKLTNDFRNGKFLKVYVCGSSYEGTVTPDLASDVDAIFCVDSTPVVINRHMAGPDMSLLLVRDSWTYPGYVKLQLVFDGRPLTIDILGENESWGFDLVGRACEKHFPGDNKHGPASMLFDIQGNHVLDRVAAYKCRGIPLWATEWIKRNRSFGWPSQQQLDDMRVMGCMLVGAGYFDSPEKDIEWRLSFSLQERMLMKSLNPVQHKVYILLKMIKKNILEKCLKEESLSSYHCKTCVFYMAEMTPAHVWTQDNLISCLLQCLKLLLVWIRNRYCPSYFFKEQNLFKKEGFCRLIEPLQNLIDLLHQTGHQFLYLLKSDSVREILRGGDLRLYRYLTDAKVNTFIFNTKLKIIASILVANFKYVSKALKSKPDALSFFMAQLENFQSDAVVPGYTTEETKAAVRHIQPWLHLSIGMEFAARAITCLHRADGKELMKKADFHIHRAKNTDLVNARLAKLSILFRSEKFEECFLLLEEIERSWTYRVMSLCSCMCTGPRIPFRNAQELYTMYPAMRDMSVRKLMTNYFTTCVTCLPSQAELVPPPLRFEMFRSLGTLPGSRDEQKDFWFDWAVVDAKVYMYFMQYLVCSKLNREPHKQVAMDNLTSHIQQADDGDLHHKETAYNLLGWINLQEHRVDLAIRCFLQSWKVRPYHNAAKFHMRNLAQRMFSI